MFSRLKSLFQAAAPVPPEPVTPAPDTVCAVGIEPFDVGAARVVVQGLPVLDWQAVHAWVNRIPDASEQARAWAACEQAWLAHLRDALGPGYRLQQAGGALLLSSLSRPVAEATLAFVNKTLQRVLRTLDGLAETPAWGHDILIVFDDDDTYYRYVSRYYAGDGEFAASGGMHIDDGCGHFVTVAADLHAIEPVIAHELTHACLGHLPIPLWLNEGLAVNTEQRLTPRPRAPVDPRLLHERHLAFWGVAQVQQFWSGQSFLRNDEGNELSYDLARLLVAEFAADWPRFRDFARHALAADGGAAAAAEHLGIDLGAAVSAVMQKSPDAGWAPRPSGWVSAAPTA